MACTVEVLDHDGRTRWAASVPTRDEAIKVRDALLADDGLQGIAQVLITRPRHYSTSTLALGAFYDRLNSDAGLYDSTVR